mmetsp:Transcript_5190/g.13104  ORF Transcript_5190/g.13104 Transcript_5190/m.13104 type:complete len:223 (+) Transcript_5190:915-1583(+)
MLLLHSAEPDIVLILGLPRNHRFPEFLRAEPGHLPRGFSLLQQKPGTAAHVVVARFRVHGHVDTKVPRSAVGSLLGEEHLLLLQLPYPSLFHRFRLPQRGFANRRSDLQLLHHFLNFARLVAFLALAFCRRRRGGRPSWYNAARSWRRQDDFLVSCCRALPRRAGRSRPRRRGAAAAPHARDWYAFFLVLQQLRHRSPVAARNPAPDYRQFRAHPLQGVLAL